jgi:hypothetical protein
MMHGGTIRNGWTETAIWLAAAADAHQVPRIATMHPALSDLLGCFAEIWHGKCLRAPGTPITAVRRETCGASGPRPFPGSVPAICFDGSKHSIKVMCRQL